MPGSIVAMDADIYNPFSHGVDGDAGFFFDGLGIINGDTLRFKSGDIAYVETVNYATNELVFSNTVQWETGDSVAINYLGSRPDVGAYEYDGYLGRLSITRITR